MSKAPKRMKEATRRNLERFIALVVIGLKGLPDHGNVEPQRTAYRKAEGDLVAVLEEAGARFSFEGGSECVTLAGTRGTSTNGIEGALRNWVKAAERRLDKAGVQSAPEFVGMDVASGADQSHYAPQGWQDSLRHPDDPKTLAAESRPNSLLGDA